MPNQRQGEGFRRYLGTQVVFVVWLVYAIAIGAYAGGVLIGWLWGRSG